MKKMKYKGRKRLSKKYSNKVFRRTARKVAGKILKKKLSYGGYCL